MTRPQLWFGALVQFVILALLSLTAADADLWGHLTFGHDILASGHVVQVDRYSFTRDLPWINHEWLAEIAMAASTRRRCSRAARRWPGAVEFARSHELRGRLVTWFDCGEYAIWHLGPAMSLSMHGRRDTIYSTAVRNSHTEIYRNGPGAIVAVAELRPD